MIVRLLSVLVLVLAAAGFAQRASAISPTITYQGFLTDLGEPAQGSYDFRFTLRDALDLPVGAPVPSNGVTVTRGLFSVPLEFPFPAFNGQDRQLGIEVRRAGTVDFSPLTPSVAVTATPYALLSDFAEGADVAGTAAVANDALLFGGRPPADYLQNQNAVAQAANFRITGTGQASIISAGTQYNLGATRVLSFGVFSVYLGEGAASAITTGNQNVFVGFQAGAANTEGSFNSFLGLLAGSANTTGIGNNFFGSETGRSTTTGCCNSFFGGSAGRNNLTGSFNTFVGERSAQTLTSGDNNTSLGANIVITTALTNATAIGARASVTQANSLVLGGITGVNGGTDTRVGIGTTAPRARLDVATGDILVGAAGAGIILKAPNGTVCRKLTVANDGTLVNASITCP